MFPEPLRRRCVVAFGPGPPSKPRRSLGAAPGGSAAIDRPPRGDEQQRRQPPSRNRHRRGRRKTVPFGPDGAAHDCGVDGAEASCGNRTRNLRVVCRRSTSELMKQKSRFFRPLSILCRALLREQRDLVGDSPCTASTIRHRAEKADAFPATSPPCPAGPAKSGSEWIFNCQRSHTSAPRRKLIVMFEHTSAVRTRSAILVVRDTGPN